MAWYAKKYGAYSRTDAEAQNNALMIYNLYTSLGWSINAICAVLGNMEAESGYNPWRWESDDVPYEYEAYNWGSGYGLVQFTPARKYIYDSNAQVLSGYAPNFYDVAGNATDGNAQMLFIDQYADYYATDSYPLSYDDFKTSTQSIDYLTAAWVYNYERPLDPSSTLTLRQEAANYWYTYLSGQPEPPEPPGPGPDPPPPGPSGPIDFVVMSAVKKKRGAVKQAYRKY